ncbi:MAG: serine hydrolase, partial [Actinomycetota bacterium]|nr:serine hydrolase [Actinomycetota bacterium]
MTTTARAAIALALALALAGCSIASPDTPVSTPPGEGSSPAEPGPSSLAPSVDPSAPRELDLDAELSALEEEFDATVGVSALDSATGTHVDFRADEPFGFASTIKLFAAAVMLRELPHEQRAERLSWTRFDVSDAGHAPVTAQHVRNGLTVLELTEAAVRESDNLALNLVVQQLGGPEGLTAGLAELGDATTRVTDVEPALNEPDLETGDNATTPAAFTATVARVLEPGTLDPADLELLLEWTSENATGDTLVRAGAPEGWTVRDKSGGAGPMRNDVAIVTPPDG